jgi:hypothetical protein
VRIRSIGLVLLLGGLMLSRELPAQEWRNGNPAPFEPFMVSPSAPVRFFHSAMRQQMSRRDAQPEEVTETGQAEEVPALHQEVAPTDPSVVPGCGPASGTRFNLEPRRNAKPQSSPSVDFLRNRVAPGIDLVVGSARDIRGFFGRLGGSDSGYYVSRGADCAAEFEGGLPRIDGLTGFGNAVVAADPARDAFFIADVRLAEGNPNVGVVRSSATTLLHPTACPPGTHSAAQAATPPTLHSSPARILLRPARPRPASVGRIALPNLPMSRFVPMVALR